MKRNKTWVSAAIIALTVCLVGFFPIILKNESIFILYGDSLEQQYTYLMGFWQKVHDLDFNLFEWSNGFGASSFSYIICNLLSPFNLLYLPFPKEWIQHMMLFVNILKMSVLAALSCVWLNKIFSKSEVAIAGSIFITFSGWIFFYFQYQFIDAFVFYPLILYFTEVYLYDHKKSGLVLSIAALTFVNYYFMYMFVPFLWLYALFRYLLIYNNARFTDVLKDGGIFLALSLLGMGLSGVILMPCLSFILQSPRLSSSLELGLFVGIKDFYKIATSLLSPILSRIEPSALIYQAKLTYQGWGGGASLYTSIFALLLLPSMIKMKDVRKRILLLIFLVILSIFLVCPYFYRLFQGSIDTRFFYMFTILASYICCEVLDEELYGNMKWNICLVLASIVFFSVALFGSWKFELSSLSSLKEQLIIQCIVFVFLIIGTYLLTRKGIRPWLFVLCLEALFSTVVFVHYNEPISSVSFGYEDRVNEVAESIKTNDKGFYRVIIDSSSYELANNPYVHQINGVSFYSSVYGYDQEQFLERIKSRWSMPNYDGKYRLYTLAGAKYWMSSESNPQIPLGYVQVPGEKYYVNTNHVELGYAVDQLISSEYLLSLPFVLQDRILQEYLAVEKSQNVDYVLSDDFTQIVEWANPAWIEVEFEEPVSDAIVYIENFGIPIVDVDLFQNGEYLRTYSYWQYHYSDFYIQPEEKIDRLIIRCQDVDGTGSAINAYLAKNASDTEKSISARRRKERFENVIFEGDQITADISLTKDSYVFTQIPYDAGWKAYDSGTEIDVHKVNGGFCGLYLSEGAHSIQFAYKMPWLKEGMIVSAFSLWILFGWMIIEKRNLFRNANKSVTMKQKTGKKV